MLWLSVREPVSAWTHFSWMLLALPATWVLWHFSRDSWLKRLSLSIFGFTLLFCYASSGLFHAVPPELEAPFRTIDHVGIYLLIAGTVTPIGAVVLRGRWRIGLVGGIWSLALLGIAVRLVTDAPVPVVTLYYLFMGWIGCLTYVELARRVSYRAMRPLWLGGLFYTTGAIINGVPWPGWESAFFGPHEVFHLFVMAGTACHYQFMLATVLPYRCPAPTLSPALVASVKDAVARPWSAAAEMAPVRS